MGNSIQKLAFPVPQIPTPLDRSLDYRFLKLKGDHKIPILYIRYPNSKNILIFSHANAIDLGACENYLQHLSQQLKVSVVGYEYLGYGYSTVNPINNDENTCSPFQSQEFPSEQGCYNSLWATFLWVQKKLKISQKNIILMGQSIGTGPTCEIASKVPICGGVILVTPFKSAVKVFTDSYFGSWIDFFQNECAVPNIKSPILFIHGTDDQIIPLDHSKELAKIITLSNGTNNNITTIWIDTADHNNIIAFPEYWKGLRIFLSHLNDSL